MPLRTPRPGMRPRIRSCRERTSRLTLLEHVFDPARTPDRGDPLNKFVAEGHEVECEVDRVGLGRNAKHATRGVELSLIHDDVFPHPAGAASAGSLLAGGTGATGQRPFFIDLCHASPICINRITRLYHLRASRWQGSAE